MIGSRAKQPCLAFARQACEGLARRAALILPLALILRGRAAAQSRQPLRIAPLTETRGTPAVLGSPPTMLTPPPGAVAAPSAPVAAPVPVRGAPAGGIVVTQPPGGGIVVSQPPG